jgi:uncharacterized protein
LRRSPDEWKVELEEGASVTALLYQRQNWSRNASLILAHGAGAGQRSPFIVAFAHALAARGLDVVTFNFLYTEQGGRLPDRRPALEACYNAVIAKTRRELPSARDRLFIGGKSMGGRIATHVCAADPDLAVAGLVLLGYPLHPPGRPAQRRDGHLEDVRRPTLIVQGSRDAFGTPDELEPVLRSMMPMPTLHVVSGGDHSFNVARAGVAGQTVVHEEIQQTIVEWIDGTEAELRAHAR